LQWSAPPNRLAAQIEEKRRAGCPLLDLTESNPTRAHLPYPKDALEPLGDTRGLLYQPVPRGLLSAREAVTDYYAGFGVTLPADRVVLTASTSEAYSYLFQLLANPGDEILSPRPSYPLFEFLAGLSSVEIRQYPLRYDGAWHIDFEALELAISPRSRAIVVVNPNNPTGSFLKTGELERLEEIALRHNLAIIADEVFCDYGFAPAADRVTTLVGDRRALTFSLSGLSKVAAMPQLKLGWIAVSGAGHQDALHALDLVADTYLSVATPVQLALPQLLKSGAIVRQAIAERAAANLAWIREVFHESPASTLNVEGGWYATLRVPNTQTEEEWALRLLQDCDLIVQPGFFYDFESEAFLVLSLLTPPEVFAEGLRRLRGIL
jgi:aspartate/methionine/tyrosine aminotransferase